MAKDHNLPHDEESSSDYDNDWYGPDYAKTRRRGRGSSMSYGRILLVLFLVFLVLVTTTAGFAAYLYSYGKARLIDGDSRATGETVFTVRSGDTLNRVLVRMEQEGILRKATILDDRTLITLWREWNDEPIRLRAGTYRIEHGSSLLSILQTLQTGGAKEFKLTIPEGKTVAETAELARRRQPEFDAERFVALSRDPDFVRQLGIDEATLEGYLYPSTYDFPPGTSPEALLEEMVRAHRRTMTEILRSTPNTSGRALREIVIIASLVEKEARVDADRPKIAGVIENRLNRGMRLQIDATVNYALGEWRRLTFADYRFESAFNTYLIDGLPPAPICSPGAASIRAALDPEEHEYLFYVHRGDGFHAFAATYEDHLTNVRAYIRNDPDALRIREERPPSTRPSTETNGETGGEPGEVTRPQITPGLRPRIEIIEPNSSSSDAEGRDESSSLPQAPRQY